MLPHFQAVAAATQAAGLHAPLDLNLDPSTDDCSIHCGLTDGATSSAEGPNPLRDKCPDDAHRQQSYGIHGTESLDSEDVVRHDAEMQRLLHQEKVRHMPSSMPAIFM
jgi:hypothetical protein